MCDPMTAIMGLVSIGASFMQYSSQMAVMNAQQQANDQWVAWQRQQAALENERQDQLRQRAEAARVDALDKMSADKQKQALTDESSRVQQEITPTNIQPDQGPQLIGDALLSGQQNMDPAITADISSQINDAAKNARSRIAALATLQSYGPSQFSIQNRANDIFRTAGNEIQIAGDERQGSLAAYEAAKQVQPVHYSASPSLWGGIASGLASAAGKAFGGGARSF